MRNYFPKRPSGAPLHTLSKLYDVPVGFVLPPPYFEAEYCLFCGRRRVAVARYRMVCLVLRIIGWFNRRILAWNILGLFVYNTCIVLELNFLVDLILVFVYVVYT